MKRFKVFIHTNPKQYLGALVAKHTFEQTRSQSDLFDVELLSTADYIDLDKRHGQQYLREGKRVRWDKNDLQSFTPLRFLPPELMGFQGRAIVIDPDVFALKDVSGLFTRDLQGKAIAARKIYPPAGGTPYWASSVMLLDCAKLTHWNWRNSVDKMFAFELDYRDWVSLATEDPSTILELPEVWNHYDTLSEQTILLHNTRRLTQPWKTGLPIDFTPQKPKLKGVTARLRRFKRALASKLKGGALSADPTTYQPHPDKNQERLFFQTVRRLVDKGTVTTDFLEEEMQRNHLRKDALKILEEM